MNPFNNSLSVEEAIYRNVITFLIDNHCTPNLIGYLGTLHRSIYPVLPDQTKIMYKKERDTLYKDYDINTPPMLLFLEHSPGINFHDWCDKDRSLNDVLTVFFQLLYTVLCFSNIGLRHNDLHSKNIFIEDIGEPVKLYFNVNGTYIELTTRYIPKIYDFDRGAIIHCKVPRNLYI